MSTLLADTIRKTGGTAGTDIKVNNSSTYVDGSNKSQNIVAAISKFWLNFSMAGTTQRSDSLNNSSITDNGTGDFSMGYTNNFNYDGYCITSHVAGHNNDGHWDYDGGTYIVTTSSLRVKAFNRSMAARDAIGNNWSAKGDLA